MSDSGASHIETLKIEKQELSRNSNDQHFSHGGQIQAHHISRRSKLNNGSSEKIQMQMTFHLDVRFRRITYPDARNWTTEALQKFKWSKLFTRRSDLGTWYIETFVIEQRKPSRNSNRHNFSLGCPIQAHHISWRSELNNGSYEEIQMVITFHSNVRFRCITYRDAQNWTTEAMKKFKWS